MRSTVLAAKNMMEKFGNITFEGDAWNESAVDLIRAAKAHGLVIMLRWTVQVPPSPPPSSDNCRTVFLQTRRKKTIFITST